MGRHSIKFKITLLLVAITTGLVVLILFINNTFAEKFYMSDKQSSMLEMYHSVDSIVQNYYAGTITSTEMEDEVEKSTSTLSVSMIIVGSDWTTLYTTNKGEDELKKRLEMSIFNGDFFGQDGLNKTEKETKDESKEDATKDDAFKVNPGNNQNNNASNPCEVPSGISGDNPSNVPDDAVNPMPGGVPDDFKLTFSGSFTENREIILQTDNYTLQKIFDSRLNGDYLELWGTLSSGDSIMIRLAIQSVKDNVLIASKFIQYVGILVILLSIIIVYIFALYITKPIKELSTIAEKMSELDFNTKYSGKDKGELGILGKSMNNMSERLEQNLSQLKSANAELQRDIAHKIEIDEMRTDFLSNVSHELKTPIALIQGYAEGLKEGISEDPESMDFYCEVIMDEANKMNNMVKKLLTLNQIECGNEELVMDRFNITELIHSIMNANELRASQKDITMEFNVTVPIYVWSDEYKIEEVVTNYITNAMNHCDFEKKIIVNITKNGDNIRVSVFNTGKNIPEEDIDNIWVKFYKVDKARTREYGGNGIGLSIVKAILDSYGKECGAINHSDGVEFWFEVDSKNE